MAGNDALATNLYENGEQITASITIQQPIAAVFRGMTGILELPQFGGELRNVAAIGPDADKFKFAAAVTAGRTDEHKLEILSQEVDRRIAWRSLPDSPIAHAGSMTLRELPFHRGTEMRVVIDYISPKGTIRQQVDKTRKRDPETNLHLALWRFRQLLETGELATTKDQPAFRGTGRDELGSGDEQKFNNAKERT
ncbi:MAG TPA: hypothetical protein VK157_07085 [Phycisphaerales bacterium]|nr:hypothetical protein [Phycisphaerales bacterium]